MKTTINRASFMKTLYSSMDKDSISQMEAVTFPGRIFLIQTEREAEKAIAYLSSFPCVGLDTETRPSFKKGETHQVALLQLSTVDTCFLIRMNRVGMPICLAQFLSNPNIMKVGVSLCDDIVALKTRGAFEPRNFVDLQDYISRFGIMDRSLRKIYANLFGMRISKRQQRSNWEADVLSEQQQKYAAIDAWACIRIYNLLKELTPEDYRLVDVKLQTEKEQ